MNVNAMNNTLAWASIFAMLWAWLKDWLPISEKTVFVFVIFLTIAVFAGLSERAHTTIGGPNGK